MKTLDIKNSKARTFQVVIIEQGDAYGLDNVLTHDEVEPLVEFYDTFNGRQFVQRYYAKTLTEGNARNVGLALDCGNPVWTLYRPEMALVCDFVANQTNA